MKNVVKILVLCLLVSGCVEDGTESIKEVKDPWVSIGSGVYVQEYTTDKGTHCVVVGGESSVGITCNWNGL